MFNQSYFSTEMIYSLILSFHASIQSFQSLSDTIISGFRHRDTI